MIFCLFKKMEVTIEEKALLASFKNIKIDTGNPIARLSEFFRYKVGKEMNFTSFEEDGNSTVTCTFGEILASYTFGKRKYAKCEAARTMIIKIHEMTEDEFAANLRIFRESD